MIPDRDHYADKDGKLTEDPERFAFQVATKGVSLSDRTAKRYGIDMLVSTDEPGAVRRVSQRVAGRNESSMRVHRIEDQQDEGSQPAEPSPEETQEAEPEAEEPKAAATKPVAKKDNHKGAKKK